MQEGDTSTGGRGTYEVRQCGGCTRRAYKVFERKKKDADETDEVIKIDEDNEVPEAKRPKLNHDSKIISTNNHGG
ncbi:hypothetical protein Tco_0173940 [Tanacetum coccineum]